MVEIPHAPEGIALFPPDRGEGSDALRIWAVRSRWPALRSWENDYTARLLHQQGRLSAAQRSVLGAIHHRVAGGGR